MPHHPYGVPQQSAPTQPAYKQAPAVNTQMNTSQYRAPFPQVSPQMSPRSNVMSPHPQMSPRSNVMSPAKPMQSQNASVNNPLSPHAHLASGPSPQPRQMPKNVAAPVQASSVSTLQALEQMVMPPSVAPGPVMPSTNMEYPPSSYRASAQHAQLATVNANPLSPMQTNKMSTSPQHHQQQWPSMSRSTGGLTNLNHQQATQMNLMPPQQSQMSNVSQTMNDMSMVPNRISPLNANPKHSNGSMSQMMSLNQNDSSNLSQLDHMHMQSNMTNSLMNNPSTMHSTPDISTPISTSSVISASSNLLDPFASVVDPIPPVIITPVSNTTSMIDQPTIPVQTNVMAEMNQQHSHIQTNMDTTSLSVPVSNNDNSNSHMAMQPVSQQLPSMQMHETDEKDLLGQNQNESQPLPSMAETFETPLMSANDQIKPMETDIQCQDDSSISKQEDSRSQESIAINFENSKQSMSSDSMQTDNTIGAANNGMSESLTNDNALQQAPEMDKQMNDGITNMNVGPQIDNAIGQESQSQSQPQSMNFDQSSNPSQYSVPPIPYDPMMTNVMPPVMTGIVQQQMYPPPMSHHAEKSMLQQQLSELYCIPSSPEILEKIKRLDDRLKLLQQHEANEQCMGGPQCVLLNPMMTAPLQMIESPQVSSTTGRGRGRSASSKPRKPRQKKSEKQQQSPSDGNVDSGDVNSTIKSTEQLPVSEDCVTQGAGLAADDMIGEMTDVNEGEDGSQHDGQELDTSTTGNKIKIIK